jgi:hypothetical protein
MSIAAFLPDPSSLLASLGDVCLAGAFIGCLLTLLEAALVLAFREGKPAGGGAQPAMTVLKPLHSAEPGLAARLAGYCEQDYRLRPLPFASHNANTRKPASISMSIRARAAAIARSQI